MSMKRRRRHSPEKAVRKLRDAGTMLNVGQILALGLQTLGLQTLEISDEVCSQDSRCRNVALRCCGRFAVLINSLASAFPVVNQLFKLSPGGPNDAQSPCVLQLPGGEPAASRGSTLGHRHPPRRVLDHAFARLR